MQSEIDTTNQNKILLVYSFHWADEIRFECYSIVTEDFFNETCNLVKQWFSETNNPIEVFVGTNEEIYIRSYDDFIQMFDKMQREQYFIHAVEQTIGSHRGYGSCLVEHVNEICYEVVFE